MKVWLPKFRFEPNKLLQNYPGAPWHCTKSKSLWECLDQPGPTHSFPISSTSDTQYRSCTTSGQVFQREIEVYQNLFQFPKKMKVSIALQISRDCESELSLSLMENQDFRMRKMEAGIREKESLAALLKKSKLVWRNLSTRFPLSKLSWPHPSTPVSGKIRGKEKKMIYEYFMSASSDFSVPWTPIKVPP